MKKGFTMVEVIVCIAITGIILALLTMIMDSASKEYLTEKSRLYNSSTVRAILLELEESIKEASYATCIFDNLGLDESPGEVKKLIYIIPKKTGSSPYLLVLKNKCSNGWELHRLYYTANFRTKTNVNTWRLQGSSVLKKASFIFNELTQEEMNAINSQVDCYMSSYMVSGLTRLSSPPALDINIQAVQDYYKKADKQEYSAYINGINENGLVYLENVKFEYFTSMGITGDNLVMDGIDNIEITRSDRDSFNILARCGEDECTRSVIMRSYARGTELEKK